MKSYKNLNYLKKIKFFLSVINLKAVGIGLRVWDFLVASKWKISILEGFVKLKDWERNPVLKYYSINFLYVWKFINIWGMKLTTVIPMDPTIS